MDRGRAAAALLALAVCITCTNAAPTASDQTALEIPEGPSNGCYYNFQHYGEGDRIMTNEPCLNCTCHNRMLMCYLRVCPFTKPIGQDCTIEKRADQCCPIVTCPDVPVDLLTSTSTSSPAEYGATGLGKLDKYGCSINGKYFPEGAKVPPSPNKPCEHCYCIRNMTTCVMQECTLHVDGCTPIYHKDVCCPVRYSCDHPEDEIPLLDDMTTTVRPTPGFLLTTTTMLPITQPSQNCIHDDQVVPDGALIKTEKACEHCYCMKGDIVCVVQECGTPMENEGKNCTSLPPRQGQCCPDTYICEGDELSTEISTVPQEIVTVPPRRVGIEGSGYRNEPDEPYTETPQFEIDSEGSGEEHLTTLPFSETYSEKETPQIIETSTVLDIISETSTKLDRKPITGAGLEDSEKFTDIIVTESSASIDLIDEITTPVSSELYTTEEHKLTTNVFVSSPVDIGTSETPLIQEEDATTKVEKTTRVDDILDEATLKEDYLVPEKDHQTSLENEYQVTTQVVQDKKPILPQDMTTSSSLDESQPGVTIPSDIEIKTSNYDLSYDSLTTTPKERFDDIETTSVNPIENEIHESDLPISSPGRIPGEGDCLLNSITYENNSVVPNINNCHTRCRCISSIIKCDPIICSAPPEYMKDCQPIYDSPESCCPTYVCSTKETTPPESHNQMSGLDITKPVLASECSSADCELQNSAQPITPDCLSDECINKNKDSSQDTQILPCEGNACEIDSSSNKLPGKDHETPTICQEDSGCVKPVEVQNECSGSSCKTEQGIECSGSDCNPEIVTESALSGSTIPEKPMSELPITPDLTNKMETVHDILNPESPNQEPTVITEGPEMYITEPIKSSVATSEESTSHTEAPQSQDTSTIKDISELPDHHAISTEASIIESGDVDKTDNPLREKEQSAIETTSLPDTFVNQITESDHSNEVIHETTYENKYQTIANDDVQKTTMMPEQITTKLNEQPVTDNQIITTELYETKPDQPIMSTDKEVHTYLPETPENEQKETTTTIIEHSQNINADTLTDQINTETPTTENLIKETVTIREHPVAEVLEETTSYPAQEVVTVVENKHEENLESDTTSRPTGTLSTKEYESTSEHPVESEHQMSTESEESSTRSSSLLETETKDKDIDSITVVTESDMEVTKAIDTSPESDDSKPISEIPYDISKNKIDKTTELPDINTESSSTEQTKESEQKTYVTEKIVVTEEIGHDVTEITEKPIEITVDSHQEISLPTTVSILTDDKPIDGIKTTEIPYTSIAPGILIDEEIINVTPEVISTEKISETPSDNLDQLYTTPPAAIVTTNEIAITSNAQDFSESEKKTTESSITESEELSSTASYSIPDSKKETVVSSLDVTSSVSPIEQEQQILTETDSTQKLEKVTQSPIELSTQESQHTQDNNSFKQHESYTTEGSYADITTSQVNAMQTEQDMLESPSLTTVLPQHTEDDQQGTSDYHEHESESSVTTTKNVDMIESDTKPDQESGTTEEYKEVHTTDSSIYMNLDNNGKPIMDTKPQSTDMEPSVGEIEPINTPEEISTEKQDSIEKYTEKPTTQSSEQEIKDDKISEPPESYTTIPEKTDLTTELIMDIETETTTSKLVSVASTIGPDISGLSNESVPLEESPISTTTKSSDLNIELTTGKETTTSASAVQNLVTTGEKEDKITSSPTDKETSNIIDDKIEIQSTTPLVDLTTKQHDREITQFEDATQRDESNLPYTISDLESSTVINDILPDSMAHKDNKLDLPMIDEDRLYTKHPEKQQPDINTEKYQEQSGEPVTEYDSQQDVVPLEVSTLTSIKEETAFTPIVSENLSNPDSALSLVTEKVHPVHEELPPETTPSHEITAQDVHVMTTESMSVSHIDEILTSTEKSTINEPVVSITDINEPIETNVKTTSDEMNIHPNDVSPTTEKISDMTRDDQSSEKLQPSITENETQLYTKSPESIIEGQSVTTESVQYNDLNELTTEEIPEKVTEAELVTKQSTVHTYQYETTMPSLLGKEPEGPPSTKEPLPNDIEIEPTISVLIDTASEKEQPLPTQPSIYPTTQSSNELYETTKTLLREKDTENEIDNQKETQQPTISDSLYKVTTPVFPDIVTDKEIENQPPTEQEMTTEISFEQATEKESQYQPVTKEPIPISDISQTTDSIEIEDQTTKEIEMEPISNKDAYETTTLVVTEKPKESEISSLTKASTINYVYETTTLQPHYIGTIKENVQETITEVSIPTQDLYESTTSSMPEKDLDKEVDSVAPFISSSSESSVTTLSSSVEITTFTHKITDLADDTQKTTESIIQYSETTPYHIELQEHTHQSIDEISSKLPTEGEITTEQYISEEPNRGDVPDKDDNINVSPTSHYDEQDLITQKEEKPFTTPTYVSPDRETDIHNEVTTEIDHSISQLPSEMPEDDKYSVIPKETEKPVSQDAELEKPQTEKYIPDEFETPKPEIPDDKIVPSEEVTKVTTHPTSSKPEETTVHSEEFDKPEEKPIETGTSMDVSKPELNEPPSDDLPAPDFPTSGGAYGQEPDYGDSEDQAFGPGTCRYGGKVYVSAQQIPRDDPCDFCFCFRSDIICLQQSCPPPIHGCHEEPIQGFCCPRYECPVSMATTLNVTTTTTTTTTTLPPHFLPHAYKGAAQRRGCQIKGHTYKVGEVVRASSGPCLHCTCGGDGQMKCDPKACTPEPMLRQMIAAAVSAKRRR